MRVINILFMVAFGFAVRCGAEESGGEVLKITKNGFEKCKDIDLKKLHIKGKACILISYIESEVGMEVIITWNGKNIFHTKISAKRPPAICFKLPVLKDIEACLKLTKVSFKPHHHGACLQLTVKALVFHKTFELGCIYKTSMNAGAILTDGYKMTRESGTLLGGWYEPRSESTTWTDKKTGRKSSKWTELAGKMSKAFRSTMASESSPVPTGKCTCPKARKCMCCNTLPKTKTQVCGRIVCSKKGKVFWLGLFVNKNKNFRVYSPAARPFTMVCGDPRISNTTTSTCLQLSKFQQSEQQLKGCLTAHVIITTSHTNIDLGCFTLKHQKTCKGVNDEKILFVPPLGQEYDPVLL